MHIHELKVLLISKALSSSPTNQPEAPGGPEALSESPRCNDMVADYISRGFSARPLNVK